MTKIVRVNKNNPEIELIDFAAKVIKEGGLVAFPTETVYGIGANSFNEEAIKKIFIAKGRPQDNPLIVHIAELEQIYDLVKEVPQKAKTLMKKFWPGPLTLIFKKSQKVPYVNTAGMDTVAIRMPSNTIAHLLIKRAEVPISAPSANVSGKPSPTDASHVIEDLYGKVDVIIDGGKCDVGVESTVLDLTEKVPVILRPGAVTLEMLREVIGNVEVDPSLLKKPQEDLKPKSPGMKYKHYSPNAEVYIVTGDLEKVVKKIQELTEEQLKYGKKVGIMATVQTSTQYEKGEIIVVGDRNRPETIAKNLFEVLRQFDKKGVDVIFAESFEYDNIGLAIMNRLEKAAGYKEISAEGELP
ncbi:L-threonylcarbamoyladenylate synthase [Thermoanaerobacter brockii subsp. lactiethylicus]|uniref:Threonylcarbamoyl-AMP synthase n=2 Tax=Thermoanaerobacter TaxID=1754 RepID=B0K7G4_THEP3|nr:MULTISPECIES: L-threonylcarbamoyladenylate synthase [Thermoanaerobacter]ABY95730.1 Sua5/YciO/YrdC/YwlC family protein [Thermoanaerobacter pseudethanolicus ATCC 33223]ADV80659.1 Sua5/YciO/YrdC/YwlC family protein [Thermoanaerobacter brockii subsp. finnii Ako-1]MDI3528656.1 L-threonylcarbamoyladenylate synthase [Thermoanaerobacter sp.]HBW59906.1 threonylcarbamoyl-AMP synthase [Thermoanaerobacter sp.]